MEYNVYEPKSSLSGKVKCYWSLEDSENKDQNKKDRVFPDGCVELLFHYGDFFKKYEDNGTSEIQPKSFVYGQITKFIDLEPTGRIGIFSVRFQPNGLQNFIDVKVSDLTDRIISLKDLWGNEGKMLETQMLSAANNEERLTIIERFLESQQRPITEKDIQIEKCVTAIMESNGIISIEKLIEEFQISKRHLERSFISNVGVSLKFFSRIIRFNYALQLINDKDFSSFTNVALDGGFYDQAHFIKDFKEITGLNPKQYFCENLEMVKFFNL
ncbi:helix-turn-helix transcriptional regulator [Flavobacterium terrisoli]|uniref:helix-turn-helix transcriptional regulator n=1 Tax=Flavobacterium terrisoli TaxID=3242195 RepID=UPI00254303F0|nr:helix-turn-helix transcriptional regulator [Flavobacterium buctense]